MRAGRCDEQSAAVSVVTPERAPTAEVAERARSARFILRSEKSEMPRSRDSRPECVEGTRDQFAAIVLFVMAWRDSFVSLTTRLHTSDATVSLALSFTRTMDLAWSFRWIWRGPFGRTMDLFGPLRGSFNCAALHSMPAFMAETSVEHKKYRKELP